VVVGAVGPICVTVVGAGVVGAAGVVVGATGVVLGGVGVGEAGVFEGAFLGSGGVVDP
jgi:hypothetical protein